MPEIPEEPPDFQWLPPDDDDWTSPQEPPKPKANGANGHVKGDIGRQASAPTLPSFLDADVSRWVGIEPTQLEFAIADLVPIGMVTLLVAPGGAGKSLLQQLAITCPATGVHFLGHAVIGGVGAGLFAEDPPNILHLRQERINAALAVDMEQLSGRVYPLSLSGHDARLWSDGKPTAYFTEMETQLRTIADLRLLAIDNVSLVFDGNENDRGDVTRFLSALTGLATRLKIGILLSTHTSKSHSDDHPASGSTAWPNAARSVLELKATEENRAVLSLFKANHAKPGLEIPLRWQDGVLVPAGGGTESGIVARMTSKGADRVFLQILAALTVEDRPVNDRSHGSIYAPKIMAARPEAGRFKQPDFVTAMERLSAAGAIVLESYGKRSENTRRWIISTVEDDAHD